MLSPLPRRSGWAYSSLCSPSRISLPRKGCRVGLRIVLFEDCSAFTRVTACTLALSPIRDTLIEGFSHFVTSMTAPTASGWSGCRVGFAPTGKRRLVTAHAKNEQLRCAPDDLFQFHKCSHLEPILPQQKVLNEVPGKAPSPERQSAISARVEAELAQLVDEKVGADEIVAPIVEEGGDSPVVLLAATMIEGPRG